MGISRDDYTLGMGVTQSLLKMFMRCPRECEYYLQRYRNVFMSDALWMGNVMHSYLDGLHHCLMRGEDYTAKAEEIIQSVNLTLKNQPLSLQDADKLDKAIAVATAMFYSYLDRYANELKTEVWKASEYKFDVPGPERMRMLGKVDGLVLRGDSLYIMEHKFKGRQSERLIDLLSLDFQVGFYFLGLSLSGWKLAGIVYDVIRPPQIRQTVKESYDEYLTRVLDDAQNRPDFYFKRFEITFSTDDMTRMARNTESIIAAFKEFIIASHTNPEPAVQYTASCERSTGVCPYLEMCSSNSDIGYRKAERLFEEIGEELEGE